MAAKNQSSVIFTASFSCDIGSIESQFITKSHVHDFTTQHKWEKKIKYSVNSVKSNYLTHHEENFILFFSE